MTEVSARSIDAPHGTFTRTLIERRPLGPGDVAIDIKFAGVCHSDIHVAHNDWGRTTYPAVPGHEIAGVISGVGPDVSDFGVGDRVGVGCMVDSCGVCDNCQAGRQQFCREGDTKTAGGFDREGAPTQGGYSQQIVVKQEFVLRIPDLLDLASAAPLLCAGVTLYSPLKRLGLKPGSKVGIVGFGGLGHIAVQLSKAMGAQTTVFDLADAKRDDAFKFGADEFVSDLAVESLRQRQADLDAIICTVPVNLDLDAYLGMLNTFGTMVLIGIPSLPMSFKVMSLISQGRSVMGSLIGGIPETQETLDYCAEHGIKAQVETINAADIVTAYERLEAGDVKYRFVIDGATF